MHRGHGAEECHVAPVAGDTISQRRLSCVAAAPWLEDDDGEVMIEGACHCGQVHWRYGPEPKGARACNCTVSRRWGALWMYGFYGEDLQVEGPTKAYVRGEAIEFHFCPRCACVVAWRSIAPGEDGRRWVR